MYLMKECPYCSCKDFDKIDDGLYECINCGEESEDWQLALVDVEDLSELDK